MGLEDAPEIEHVFQMADKFDKAEKEEIIKKVRECGARFVDTDKWDMSCTHVVAGDNMRWSEKVMAALAAGNEVIVIVMKSLRMMTVLMVMIISGKWVVTKKYLDHCLSDLSWQKTKPVEAFVPGRGSGRHSGPVTVPDVWPAGHQTVRPGSKCPNAQEELEEKGTGRRLFLRHGRRVFVEEQRDEREVRQDRAGRRGSVEGRQGPRLPAQGEAQAADPRLYRSLGPRSCLLYTSDAADE